MFNFVFRKRTQTPKFRMSFLSFYCGDNQGKKKNLYFLFVILVFLLCSSLKMNSCFVLFFGSVVSSSPELQALLMNQLTIKVIFSYSV